MSVPTTTAENLSRATIQSYRRQGFVHIPGIISQQEAEEFRGAATHALERLQDRSLTKGRGRAEQIFTQIVNVWREDEAMARLTLHPNIGAVARKLAGVPLRVWHDHMLVKQPHNNAATEFHQDRPFWP